MAERSDVSETGSSDTPPAIASDLEMDDGIDDFEIGVFEYAALTASDLPGRRECYFSSDEASIHEPMSAAGQPHIKFPYDEAEMLMGSDYILAAQFFADVGLELRLFVLPRFDYLFLIFFALAAGAEYPCGRMYGTVRAAGRKVLEGD